MTGGPSLEIDLDKIVHNAAQIVKRCQAHNIKVLGVTKGFCALPPIVNAMIGGGIEGLADARLENIVALRSRGFYQHITMLRIPRLSRTHQVAANANASVNSELVVVKALSLAVRPGRRPHEIILMVDVGDLREGVMPENVLETARAISLMKGVKLAGLGTNMGCFGGVLPSPTNLGLLAELRKDIEEKLGFELNVISGGGTSTLKLIEDHSIPPGINQVRIGEGVLLGTDTTHNQAIPYLSQDAFILKAEVVEVKAKPSVPIGEVGRSAFGDIPAFKDRGIRKRAIVALGRQDVATDGLLPLDDRTFILGASSDHMIIDVEESASNVKVGSQIAFRPNYKGVLNLCSSKYVNKTYKGGEPWLNSYRESIHSLSRN